MKRVLVFESKANIEFKTKQANDLVNVLNAINSKTAINSPADVPAVDQIDSFIFKKFIDGSKTAKDMNAVKTLSLKEVNLPGDLQALKEDIERFHKLNIKRNDSLNFIRKSAKSFEVDYQKLDYHFDNNEQYRRYITQDDQVRRLEMANGYLLNLRQLGVFPNGNTADWQCPFVSFNKWQDPGAVYPYVNLHFVVTGAAQ